MRKIVERVVLVIFGLVVLYIGWTVFQNFYDASSTRNENAAVQIVEEIRETQLRLRPKFGRYLTLDAGRTHK